MEIKTHTRGAVAIVELHGRFDANTMPQVKQALERAATARVIVNLADVHFIDSSGLSALIGAMKRCRQGGGDLNLCCLQQPVRIIFELTKLDRAFEMFATEKQAVAAFGG
jgi:anti-sigma B factor antagonist